VLCVLWTAFARGFRGSRPLPLECIGGGGAGPAASTGAVVHMCLWELFHGR
jgi:hypothetical protein